jgi:hypothetical protein
MWFEALTGFSEDRHDDVAGRFTVDGELLTSRVNGRTMRWGRFETPSLAELRRQLGGAPSGVGSLRARKLEADVQALHADPANAGALFQVASQFNTLEMVGPDVTPEAGIDGYEGDPTQGPACAIACGAGTIYRNYLVRLEGRAGQAGQVGQVGQVGQSREQQIDCLADLAVALGLAIEMRNGYALATGGQLDEVRERLADLDEAGRHRLMGHLRIGLQWDTQVTLPGPGHAVTQAYCSALPIAYSRHQVERWEPFARLVLDAAYEATLAAAVLNARRTGNPTAYLTFLGGGAFGNPRPWIVDAIDGALGALAGTDLDVVLVSRP